jgi:peptide/nickel transport system substrate-binding protein
MRGGMRAAGLTAALLLATACTSGADGEGATSSARMDALRGGSLRGAVPDALVAYGFAGDVYLDPQRAYSELPGLELLRCCLVRTLFSYNSKLELRPDLAAANPEVSSDGLTWTFRLRPGLRYSPPFDRTQIVALDVVRAIEREARVKGGFASYYSVIRGFVDYQNGLTDSIVGLETPDDRTLVIQLDRAASDLAYRFSLLASAPVPEGVVDGHDEDYQRYLVASGPYMVEGSDRLDFSVPPDQQEPSAGFLPPERTAGTVEKPGSLVLVRNPSWDPATDRLRPAYPDRIELTLGGDEEEVANLVDAGDLDLSFGAPSPFDQVSRYREDPELSGRVFVDLLNFVWPVAMNLAVPPFDDIHVRRAVALAIDKSSLVDMLSRPPYGPFGIHTGEVATHIAPDAIEGNLLRAFDPYPYDPARARAEMRSSAYDRTGDGRCDVPACRDVKALVIGFGGFGVISDQGRPIRGDLDDLGIELDLEVREIGRFFRELGDPRRRIPLGIGAGWVTDLPGGFGWFPPLFASSALGESNWSLLGAGPARLRAWGYSAATVPNVDDRIQACLTRSSAASTECWAELDQYLMTEVVPWVPYLLPAHAQVVSERVLRYSFDQFVGLPALDRIALAPGSAPPDSLSG